VTEFTLLEGATNVKTPDGFYGGCTHCPLTEERGEERRTLGILMLVS
jgi:hypothetical protein